MDYYLVSTPLHVYIACGLAVSKPVACKIIFIDQYPNQADPFIRALQSWPDNPFSAIEVFPNRDLTGLKKERMRRHILKHLAKLAEQDTPLNIHVGNDRHIEFQYLMHFCRQKLGLNTQGIYLDEGLFTYIGRRSSERFGEQVIDNVVRKLLYGFWWQSPSTIGGSKWISQIIVAFPNRVHAKLKQKSIATLDYKLFQSKPFENLCQTFLVNQSKLILELGKLDIIITLPEKTDINQIADYQQGIEQLIQPLSKSKNIGIKYHPSAKGEDPLNLAEAFSCLLIADYIPFEMLLPHMPANIILLGDMSSTLVTAKILKPSAQIYAFKFNNSVYYQKYQALFSSIGIDSLTIDQLTNRLLAHSE